MQTRTRRPKSAFRTMSAADAEARWTARLALLDARGGRKAPAYRTASATEWVAKAKAVQGRTKT